MTTTLNTRSEGTTITRRTQSVRRAKDVPSDRARITRAITEPMEIVPTDKPWRFTVRTAHGVYTVDAQANDGTTIMRCTLRVQCTKDVPSCTCPDFRNRIAKMRRRGDRNAACKHLLRVTNGKRLLEAQLLVGNKQRSEWKEAV